MVGVQITTRNGYQGYKHESEQNSSHRSSSSGGFLRRYIRNRGKADNSVPGTELSARDSRDDRDFSAIRDRCREVFQEPNVFTIQVNIDEAAQAACFVADAG